MQASDIANAYLVLQRVASLQQGQLDDPALLGLLRAEAFIAGVPLKLALQNIEVTFTAENNSVETSHC